MRDHLPGESRMRSLFETAGLEMNLFIDEPGFDCICAAKMDPVAAEFAGRIHHRLFPPHSCRSQEPGTPEVRRTYGSLGGTAAI
jgi:hypothetical protein